MTDHTPPTDQELDAIEAWTRSPLGPGLVAEQQRMAVLVAEVRRLRAILDAEKTAHLFTLRQRNNRSQRLAELHDLALAGDLDGLAAAAKNVLAASVDDHRGCGERAAARPAVRAAVLRALADQQTQLAVADDLARRRDIATARRQLVKELRRLAAEAQQPETCLNCRGSGLDPRYNGEYACPDCAASDDAEAPQPDTETRVPAEDPARVDRLRPEFTEHASIEAIDAQLRRARAQERRWHLRTEWLISLRADRVAQKERGEWPDAASAAAGPGRAADTQDDEEA